MPVSVAEVALSRGAASLEQYESVGLPAAFSCFVCGNNIPASAAFLSQAGRIKCLTHIGGSGFRTVDQWEKYAALYTLHKREGGH